MKKALIILLTIFLLTGCGNKLSVNEYLKLKDVVEFQKTLYLKQQLFDNEDELSTTEFVDAFSKFTQDNEEAYIKMQELEVDNLSEDAEKLHKIYKELAYNENLYNKSMSEALVDSCSDKIIPDDTKTNIETYGNKKDELMKESIEILKKYKNK